MTAISLPSAPGLSLPRSFGRMYLRNKMQLFFSLIFPLMFLALFVLLGTMTSPDPTVDVVGSSNSVATAGLTDAGIGLVRSPELETALESLRGGQVLAVVDPGSSSIWVVEGAGQQAITDLADTQGLTLIEVSKDEVFNFIRFGLPGILTFATLNVAFFGTTSTLVELRKEGALNLLRRTPAGPLKIVLAPIPSKLAGYAVVYSIVVASAWKLGYISVTSIPTSIGIGLVSFAAATTWAYLVGARGTQPEVSGAVSGMLLPVLLMGGGVLIPFEILPGALQKIASFTPIAHIGSLYRWSITGVDPTWSIWTSLAVIVASSAIALVLTVRLFRWR